MTHANTLQRSLFSLVAMGQNPNRTPVNIIPTKIGSKMGGEFTYQPKWDPIGFDNHSLPPDLFRVARERAARTDAQLSAESTASDKLLSQSVPRSIL